MIIPEALTKLAPTAQWSLSDSSDYETLEWLSPEVPKPTLEEVNAKIAELQAAQPMEALRQKRNKLLTETDWVTWKAYSQGVSVPEEWATYQQALRDLPENTTDPANPVWPTKPS